MKDKILTIVNHLNTGTLLRQQVIADGIEQIALAIQHPLCTIQELSLDNYKISDVDIAYLAQAFISGGCNIHTLSLRYNKITDAGAVHLALASQHPNCKIQKLNLSDNNIADVGTKHLVTAIKHSNSMLSWLDLGSNEIKIEGVKHLIGALLDTTIKIQLYFNHNPFGLSGAEHIALAIQNPDWRFQSLDISGCEIGNEGAKYLASALQNPACGLQSLNIANNNIGNEGLKYLASALQNPSCSLQSLDIYSNNIEKEGIEYFAVALQCHPCRLLSLNLSWNKIGDESAKHLAMILQNPDCKIQTLGLSNVGLEAPGINYLANAIIHNPDSKLEFLDLSKNYFGDEAVKHLAHVLQHSFCKIRTLNLAQDNMSDMSVSYLTNAIILNPYNQLRELIIIEEDREELGDGAAESFARIIQHPHCKLLKLVLSSYIGDKGLIQFAAAIQNPVCKLQSLEISDGLVGDEGLKHFANAIQNPACKLLRVDLQGNVYTSEGLRQLAIALQNPLCQILELRVKKADYFDGGHITEIKNLKHNIKQSLTQIRQRWGARLFHSAGALLSNGIPLDVVKFIEQYVGENAASAQQVANIANRAHHFRIERSKFTFFHDTQSEHPPQTVEILDEPITEVDQDIKRRRTEVDDLSQRIMQT